MPEWLVQKEDCGHWLQVTEQFCGGVGATIATTKDCIVDAATKGSKQSQLSLPSSETDIHQDPSVSDEIAASSDDSPKEDVFLQTLRSNPSLVRSATSSSSVAPQKTVDNPTDQHSIGSETFQASDDDDESLVPKVTEQNRDSKRFRLSVIFALVLLVLSIVLGVAIMLQRRKANNNLSIPNDEKSDETNVENLFDENVFNEDDAGNGDSIIENLFDKGDSGKVNITYDYTSNSEYLVGAYYYPWYGEDFHQGGGYLRKNLVPPQQPALGEYNDSDAEIIGQHMKWFRQANIGLLVTSWWGPNRTEDRNTKDVILEHEDIGNLKIALHYETTGRIIKDNSDMSVPRNDLQYICENYFDHPNYYKIDGRPVLFVYITRVLHSEGVLEEALLTMRSEASKCGHNLYLIGDQVFQSAPNPDEAFVPFWYFDAVTNFDVYGSSGRPDGYAGKEAVDQYYAEQEQWKKQALEENCRYVPPVSPGYNDRSVRLEKDNPPLSRRLTAGSEEGSLFWYQLKQALQLVDPQVDSMIMVNSFNEWHEDTQIEPAVSIGSSFEATNEPELYTRGLEYVGYDELYLDILGAATSKNVGDNSLFDHLYDAN